LPPNGILSGAKFTLHPSLALSCIGSVTARHSSTGRQPNFAARYLYATGRPSRPTLWAVELSTGTPATLRSGQAPVGYISYSEADFEVFRPAGPNRCTDGSEMWRLVTLSTYRRYANNCICGGGDLRGFDIQTHPETRYKFCKYRENCEGPCKRVMLKSSTVN